MYVFPLSCLFLRFFYSKRVNYLILLSISYFMQFKEYFNKNKTTLVPLIIVLIIVAAIDINYLGLQSFWPDESLYVGYANSLAKDPGFLFSEQLNQFIVHFPIIIISSLSFMGTVLAAKITILLFLVFGIFSTYLLGSAIKDKTVGLFSAIFFALLPLTQFLTSRILLDVPIAAMVTFTLYCTLKYEKEKNMTWAAILGTAIFLTIFTKNAGILVLPIIGVYALLFNYKKISSITKKPNLAVFAFVVLTIVVYLLRQFLMPNIQPFTGFTAIFSGGPLAYLESLPFILSWYLIPFFLVGLVFTVLNVKSKKYLLLLLALGAYFIVISFLVPEKEPRYAMPVIPLLTIMCAYGLSKLRINKQIGYVLIAFSVIILVPIYLDGYNLTMSKSFSYTGFPEAGNLLKTIATKDSIIYASSARSMYAFSGFKFEEYGGNIRLLPQTKEEFETVVNNTKDVYIELDMWEYTQPDWIYPWDQEKIGYLQSLNFTVVKAINKPVLTQQGLTNQTVVAILKKI